MDPTIFTINSELAEFFPWYQDDVITPGADATSTIGDDISSIGSNLALPSKTTVFSAAALFIVIIVLLIFLLGKVEAL